MKRGTVIAAQLLVTAALLWWLFRGFDWHSFRAIFGRMPAWFYVLSFAVVSAGQMLYAWRWGALLKAADVRIPYRTVLAQFLVGNFVNTFLPSTVGGDAARVYYLGRQHGYRTLTASVILDRLLGIGFLAALGVAALTLSPIQGSAFMAIRVPLGIVLAVALVSVLGVASGTGGLSRRVRMFGSRAVAAAEHMQAVRLDMAAAVTSPKTMAMAAASVFIYFVSLTGVYDLYIVGEIGHEVPFIALLAAVAATAAIANVPISVGGLGVREQLHVVMLRPLGVSKEIAVAISLLLFGQAVLVNLIGGYVWIRHRPPVTAPVLPPEPLSEVGAE